jgi:hypothetical protein
MVFNRFRLLFFYVTGTISPFERDDMPLFPRKNCMGIDCYHILKLRKEEKKPNDVSSGLPECPFSRLGITITQSKLIL